MVGLLAGAHGATYGKPHRKSHRKSLKLFYGISIQLISCRL